MTASTPKGAGEEGYVGRAWRWGRLAAAVAVAAFACLLVRWALPRGLDLRTDVVGYPIHQNFDVFAYFRTYYVVALLFPLATLFTYGLLGRLGPASGGRAAWWRFRPPLAPNPAPVPEGGRAALGRLLLVGAVIGLELAFMLQPSRRFWLVVGTVAVGYAGVLTLIASVQRVPLPLAGTLHRRPAANAMAAPLTVLLLYGVSASAKVTLTADGSVRHYPWMPLWLAVAGTAVLLAAIGRAIARSSSNDDLLRLERRVVLLVAGSVGLFLVVSQLPGAVGGVDFFHQGEHLAAANLVGQGSFPWRDVIFIHGLFDDVVRGGLGLWVFESNVWGSLAGQSVFVGPLYWVSVYLLNVYLFGRNWLFLVLTVVLVLQGWLTPSHNRFILVPLILLLLAALLREATRLRAFAFVAVGVTSVVVTPESAFAVLAAGAAVVAFEAWYREPGERLARTFRRTRWCAAAAVALVAAWFSYLALNGALGSFLFYFRTFIPDHTLTGGIPVLGKGFDFWFAVVAPVASAMLVLWCFGRRLVRRQPVAVAEWVMASLGVFVLLYYRKFLSRADNHAFQVLAASLPLLYYLVHQVARTAEAALDRYRWSSRVLRITTRHPVTLGLVVLVIAATPGPPLLDSFRRIPHSWDVAVPERLPRLGYSTATAVEPGLVHDLDVVLDAIIGPDGHLFDMSNSPALFHFLLDARPATRYYHISMAVRKRTQSDLISQLRRTRPKLVVLDGNHGLPTWDGILNTVRHYDVTEYVLRRYRPLARVRSFLLLIRSDVEPPALDQLAPLLSQPLSTDILAGFLPCDWGYAPEFLSEQASDRPRSAGQPVPFTVTRAAQGQDVSINIPEGLRPHEFSRLEIEAREPLRANTFSLSPSPAGSHRPITFKTLGGGTRRSWVRVGSCPQWHAFSAGKLSLRSKRDQEIVAVRLYR